MKDDLVVQRRLDAGARAQGDAIEQRVDVSQCADLHLQPELHLQRALPRSRLFDLNLVVRRRSSDRSCVSETFFFALK